MPDYRSLFDNQWVKAWDLGDKPVTLTIERVEAGTIENRKAKKADRMPILWFKGAKKPFGCNRTNAKTIAGLYGTKTEAWIGKAITIYPTKTQFGNDEVDCIRVKPQVPTGKASAMPEPPPPPAEVAEPGSEG